MKRLTVGIVGFGSMGRMIAERLIDSGSVDESRTLIHTRTKERTRGFRREYPDAHVHDSPSAVFEAADVTILCVPPAESPSVLKALRSSPSRGKILVSVVGSLSIKSIERILPMKVVRAVPSVTAEVGEGMLVASANDYCNERDIGRAERLLGPLGEVLFVPESKIELYTDLTSCSPGILSAVFEEYANAATRAGAVSRKQATHALTRAIYGLAKLYEEECLDFAEVIARVARRGGTTEIGIESIRAGLPSVFDEVFDRTLKRQRTRRSEIDRAIKKEAEGGGGIWA